MRAHRFVERGTPGAPRSGRPAASSPVAPGFGAGASEVRALVPGYESTAPGRTPFFLEQGSITRP